MVENLILGLPEERPGGLVLTLMYFAGSALIALLAGLIYAMVCVTLPRTSLLLQAACACLRGVPVILLIFLLGQLNAMPLSASCLMALTVYSFVHVGEILRGFLRSYPATAREQAQALGIGVRMDWTRLRLPWTFRYSFDALTTHWISLLKDTGALVILSVGELTTVAKSLTDSSVDSTHIATVLTCAAALYLGTTLTLIGLLKILRRLSSHDVAHR
jgi:ABC-type amino acid transport system permease subunit